MLNVYCITVLFNSGYSIAALIHLGGNIFVMTCKIYVNNSLFLSAIVKCPCIDFLFKNYTTTYCNMKMCMLNIEQYNL